MPGLGLQAHGRFGEDQAFLCDSVAKTRVLRRIGDVHAARDHGDDGRIRLRQEGTLMGRRVHAAREAGHVAGLCGADSDRACANLGHGSTLAPAHASCPDQLERTTVDR